MQNNNKNKILYPFELNLDTYYKELNKIITYKNIFITIMEKKYSTNECKCC